MRVNRSASGGLESAAGGSGGAGGGASGGGSPPSRRRGGGAPRGPAAPDLTELRVPGLQLRLHYGSRTERVPAPAAAAGRAAAKRAALFARITLRRIPEETVLSPHVLEFVERALEPIPARAPPPPPAVDPAPPPLDPSQPYAPYVYASFPVDVIVHFHMQPSAFRFSCLPASRVECLLQLPSLQIVFSSKRATDE